MRGKKTALLLQIILWLPNIDQGFLFLNRFILIKRIIKKLNQCPSLIVYSFLVRFEFSLEFNSLFFNPLISFLIGYFILFPIDIF